MRNIFLLFFFIKSLGVQAQALPPIINFSPADYEAGNQNWMVSQGSNKHIFVANNSGLLHFDGEHWDLYQVPGETAVRSVLVSGKFIFTGAYMEFGYWQAQENGRLKYFSLKDSVAFGLIDGEQFWDIKEVDEYVVFQSHQRLYSFNKTTGKVTTLVTEKNISNLFKVRGKIYYQVAQNDLYVIENGVGQVFVSNNEIDNKFIVGLFEYTNDKILAVTRDKGLFVITGTQWEPFPVENYPLNLSLFSALYLEDGTLALGSIGEGLYILSLDGILQYHLSQPTLFNNTILSLMEDDEGNIWTALDNGISLVNYRSPYRIFVDTFGKIGTVYCSTVVDRLMYLGTNQGLYYKNAASEEPYLLIPGTKGQVWSLNYLNNTLYAGHDRGTFEIHGTQASLIWEGLGTWTVEKMGAGILQGHYNGLSYLPDNSPTPTAHPFEDFDLSVQDMVVENDSIVWMSHYHKGIFRLELDQNYKNIKDIRNYQTGGISEFGPDVFMFEDEIYYSTEDEVYKFQREDNQFTSQNELNRLSKDTDRISGASEVLKNGSWWTFGTDNLYFVTRDPFEQELVPHRISIPLENRNISKGYENISLIGKNRYLVGSNGGYIEFSLPLEKVPTGDLSLNSIATASEKDHFSFRALENSDLDLKRTENNIIFLFSIPNYQALSKAQYSYRLQNFTSSWSNWDGTGTARFENLPPGKYTFQVKGKIDGRETEVESFEFAIAPAWYYSWWAFIIYFALFLLGLILVHYTYKRRHKKITEEREKDLRVKNLEAEQEIIRLQKEHLEKDMAEKNGQLAASTMSLVKKNEFLSNLRQELKGAESAKVKGVIKTIDRELSEEDNWEMFQEAFRNADKEFFDKIKAKHPELTSNDLRLCAYLRLNLSSKEVAPLINISVKSVEIKRYRLRKKLNLPREVNLTDYIMNL